MNNEQLAALLGFAFVAIWALEDFGTGLLCLAGAAAFVILYRIYTGEIDLGELQSREGGSERGSSKSR